MTVGTGSLIAKNLILTSASNVYRRATHQFASKIEVAFSVEGRLGRVYEVGPRMVHFNEKFSGEPEGSYRYDYAVLQVEHKHKEVQVKGNECY